MWLPKKIKLNNFISHKNSEFVFKQNATTMIQGINLDDDSQESNGSGKSAVIEATIFAITGDSFRKVRAIELISNNESETNLEIELYNTVSSQTLLIKRNIKRRGGSEVKVFINGNEVVQSSVNEYNKYILDLLDISKEDLMNYFVVSKEKYQSFLLSTDSKKKEIISRFSNSNLIDGVDKIIEKDVKEYDDAISELNNLTSKIDGQVEVYNEQINNQQNKTEFENNKKQQIDKISVQIDALLKENNINDISINKKEKALESAKKAEQEISTEDFDKKLKNVEEREDELIKLGNEIKSTVQSYEDTISEINKNLAGSVECPKCKHEFITTDPDFDVVEFRNLLPELENSLFEEKNKLENSRSEYKTIDTQKKEIKKQIQELKDKKHELKLSVKTLENEILNLEKNNQNNLSTVNRLEKQILSIQELTFKSDAKDVKDKIKNLLNEKEQILEQISELEVLKSQLVEWVYNFKKFKTHLTNKSIRSIEAFTNLYLTKIKTNLNVKLDGYKLLADGKTIRENITVEIMRNGLIEGPIEKFSGGEKVRIDICNILALQKLINLNSKSGGLDLLLLDEIIESVDSAGVNEILKQLNSINQTIAIITHANNVRNYENIKL
ncbi:MAG TPA: hypothetical protein PKI46_02470 [Bacteroidales bacterium]|nr:hypothetical protein [Bacteroidales bacterium]